MTEFQFFIFYPILILIAGFFCLGFYIITQHQKVLEPSGNYRFYGKIFKGWSMFWLKEIGANKNYFEGEQLEKKRMEIERTHAKFRGQFFTFNGKSLQVKDGFVFYQEDLFNIEMTARVKTEWRVDVRCLFLYEPEPVYRFPEWVRMITGGCPPCMSSAFGSSVYWSVYLVQPSLYSWAYHPTIAAFVFWVGFCISLSCLNVLIFKKTN